MPLLWLTKMLTVERNQVNTSLERERERERERKLQKLLIPFKLKRQNLWISTLRSVLRWFSRYDNPLHLLSLTLMAEKLDSPRFTSRSSEALLSGAFCLSPNFQETCIDAVMAFHSNIFTFFMLNPWGSQSIFGKETLDCIYCLSREDFREDDEA